MGVVTKQDTTSNTMKLPSNASSFALRRTSEWVFSQDIPSDITVEVGVAAFALHKFPLVARCGWIRKLVAEAKDSDISRLELPDIPGGAEAFELAAKFCYGISFELNAKSVAMLRCTAEYLEMSEDYGVGNLISRTEAYLNEVLTSSLMDCVAVLQSCENLLPMAEELNIVCRCVDVAASKVCMEHVASSLSRSGYSSSGRMDSNGSFGSNNSSHRKSADGWAEELSVLRIDFYQRVLSAMRARGLRYDILGGAIMQYAQRSLRGLIKKQSGRDTIVRTKFKVHDTATTLEHEQRILVETIVSLLPPERNTASVSFLFGLLRTAIYLDTTIACRLDLERRIGMQLVQATLDDLLIPSHSYNGDTLFDVDTVHRIVMNFLQQEGKDEFQDPLMFYESESMGSPSQSSIMKVARLLDCYLAEIAPDANLSLDKFISLAELMPDCARVVDDGLYRAIDIYLKTHPVLNELERKKVCSIMDCQKLSQEACTHAAQNERLPVQVVVQVLYFEQMRLRSELAGGGPVETAVEQGGPGMLLHHHHHHHHKQQQHQQQLVAMLGTPTSATWSPCDEFAAVRRENLELKMEMARMKARLQNLEKKDGHEDDDGHDEEQEDDETVMTVGTPTNWKKTRRPELIKYHQNNSSINHTCSSNNSSSGSNNNVSGSKAHGSSRPSFLQSFSKKLGKLNPFQRSKDTSLALAAPGKTPRTPNLKSSRRRRHSIS